MNNPADDRRVRKTKKALRQGLVSLLAKKNLKDISVRELTDTVDLHRGTFYVHYRDIYELYDKMWQEMIADIQGILQKYPADLSGGTVPTFRAIMDYAWENRDICRMFFGPNVDQSLVRELTRILEDHLRADCSILFPDMDPGQRGYLQTYVVGGCMGILRRWVDTGMVEPPQQMATLLERAATSAIHLMAGNKPALA